MRNRRPSIPGRRPTVERAGVYAVTRDRDGERVTFRVGQPVDWHTAQRRWLRLFPTPRTVGRILYRGRSYPVSFYEVRHVDRYGRRLDSNRSDQVIPVPYSAHRAR